MATHYVLYETVGDDVYIALEIGTTRLKEGGLSPLQREQFRSVLAEFKDEYEVIFNRILNTNE